MSYWIDFNAPTVHAIVAGGTIQRMAVAVKARWHVQPRAGTLLFVADEGLGGVQDGPVPRAPGAGVVEPWRKKVGKLGKIPQVAT